MSESMINRNDKLARAFYSWLNKVVLSIHFKDVQLSGLEHIPTDGPFLAIANHQSRWDGLLLFRVLNRVVNYMVSPNELRGFQGKVIKSVGGFPADRKFNLLPYMEERLRAGEGIAIFPEGNVFRDGVIHPFKKGAAHLVLMCYEKGIKLPVIPIAINYDKGIAQLAISKPIDFDETIRLARQQHGGLIETITGRLQALVSDNRDRLRKAAAMPGERQRYAILSNIESRHAEIV